MPSALWILFAVLTMTPLFAFDFPKVGERTCTLHVTKVKKDKKDRVLNVYGYRRTDAKKVKFEVDVNWKKIDKDSRDALDGVSKGDVVRVVYAWGFTGRYMVKAREFTEKQQKEEDEKIAAGSVDEDDDADADDDEGEKAAGKQVTHPKKVDDDPAEDADEDEDEKPEK